MVPLLCATGLFVPHYFEDSLSCAKNYFVINTHVKGEFLREQSQFLSILWSPFLHGTNFWIYEPVQYNTRPYFWSKYPTNLIGPNVFHSWPNLKFNKLERSTDHLIIVPSNVVSTRMFASHDKNHRSKIKLPTLISKFSTSCLSPSNLYCSFSFDAVSNLPLIRCFVVISKRITNYYPLHLRIS